MAHGATILGCAARVLGAQERAFFADADPWGFILFARNVETPDQVRRLTADLREAVGRDAPVLIDQEGGRVARMRPPNWREWPAPLDMVAAAGAAAAQVMYLRYRIIAAELRALGIDVNCVPCADIAHPDTHPVLHNRCYGFDPASVTEIARSVAQAHLDGGVLPVIKHIPGHGRATLDSHKALPRVRATAEALRASDFAPFRALADLPLGMSAHVVFEAFEENQPATTSPDMIRLIRNEIGFQGLLMSDDISMQALRGSVASRSTAARAAGIDVILHCNGDLAEMQAVAAAAGQLAPKAVKRATKALDRRNLAETVDIAGLEAELGALLKGGAHG